MKKIAFRLLLAVTLLLPGAVLGAPTASAQPTPPADSAVTKSGEVEFADLNVTVSKTKDLINESVTVKWTGGKQTVVDSAHKANFLQIMQCWGDDLNNGPDRTQCQFGAIIGEPPAAGTWVRSRQVDVSGLEDAKETLKRDPSKPADLAFVPFWAAGKERPQEKAPDGQNEFYDAQITNEVPVARTRGDGTGEVEFEVQTVRESAGLGCGEPVDVDGVTKARSCWLVIVPRGVTEVDNAVIDVARGLQTSPLSQTNWDKKITFSLEFRPVGRACPLGAPERRLIGHELVVGAVSSWQPELCKGGGTLYGFTQLSDDLSRGHLLEATDPGLTLMSRPVSPEQQRPDRPVVYAPVALSGLTFAFNIVKQPSIPGPEDGVPFTEMKLTPRLVAKLLTQSYRGAIAGYGQAVPDAPPDVPGRPARLQNNPLGLTADPEFLELNREYEGFQANPQRVDTLVQLGTSDLTALLWDWVLADRAARAFVSGEPDEHGMVVNELNKDLQPPLDTYPRNDQTCGAPIPIAAPFPISNCTGDEHQFANDMHEAGRAASRGDPLGRDADFDFSTNLKKLNRKPRQPITERSLLAVVDAATADLYGLPTAMLQNAAGEFVAPGEAGLRAGLDAMKPSAVPGVLQPDPATMNRAAYPLTSLSYAATSPAALTEVAGRELATFLRYAAGPGQQPGILPGQLPPGYVPLPEPQRAQTLAAATIIETQAGKAIGGDSPEDTPTGSSSTNTGSTNIGSTNIGSTGSGAGGIAGNGAADGTLPASPTAGAAPAAVPPGAPEPGAAPVSAGRQTPALPAPAVGALLVALLVCGGAASALAPLTHRYGATQRNDTGKGGDTADRTAARSRLSWLTARLALLTRRR
ncbi:MAG: hypothetical protein ACRDSZ_07925 [Pseudonocardiaceae bacterium]